MRNGRLAATLALTLTACGDIDPQSEALGSESQELIGQNWTRSWQASVKTSLSSSEGDLSTSVVDWAHFTATTISGGPFDGIKNLKKWGNSATIPSGPLAFSWTLNGNKVSDVRSHLRSCGSSASFELDVSSSPKGRVLRLYVGAHNAKVVANAMIASSGVSINTIQNANGAQFGYYDVEYSSAQAGVLKVDLQMEQAGATPLSANSCISLLAARVKELGNTSGNVTFSSLEYPKMEGWGYPITVSASHADGVRGVELFYDNVKIGEDLVAPYDFTINMQGGRRKLHAEVTTNRSTTFKVSAPDVIGWHYYSNLFDETIPDAGGWVEGALTASTPVAGKSVKAVQAHVSIKHPYVGDLQLKLVSPNDREVILSQNNGGGGANYDWTYFRDDRSVSITQASPPFDGHFRPQQPLGFINDTNGMVGQPSSGAKPWRLSIRDSYASDVGQVEYRQLWLLLD